MIIWSFNLLFSKSDICICILLAQDVSLNKQILFQISMERQSIAAGFEHLGLSVTQQLIRGKWTDTSDGDTKVC